MKNLYIKELIESKYPCQVGFLKARLFTELKDHLQKYHEINNDLQILENNIDRRINPYLIFPEVKSIIVVLFPYLSHHETLENTHHVVSRSSWGVDYHLVIKDKLKDIETLLKNQYQSESVVLCDNHPLHERHLAYLAGLGQYGKNTLLINPRYGSYFFIGLILTDLELSEENNEIRIDEDICQNCNRCLKACPTGAISEKRILNASQCMSYLTQSKAEIPEEFLSKFTKFSFGCDFCQTACVYNSNVNIPVLDEFKPKGIEVITVKNLEDLSNRTFNEKYRTLAASFRGKNVLLRNAILVSANTKNFEDLENIDKINIDTIGYLKQAIEYAKKKKIKEET